MLRYSLLGLCRYERFLKIMILSVLKNTQRPVKFWFIKNYLSPQFKVLISSLVRILLMFWAPYLSIQILHAGMFWFSYMQIIYSWLIMQDVIPHMAQEYGFEYELITYKWPSWLHKQKEKQRIIWAYKILFLDVIFPLSLEKVPFHFFCIWDCAVVFFWGLVWIICYTSAGYICWCRPNCQGRHGRTVWHEFERTSSSIYPFLWQQ